MLNVAVQCHLNGVVHRDMKPEVCSRTTCMDMLMGRLWMMQWSLASDKKISLYKFIICTVWTPQQWPQTDENFGLFIISFSSFKRRIHLSRPLILGYLTISDQYKTFLFPLESSCTSHNILQLLGTIWSALELSSVNTGYPFRFWCRQKVPWCGGKCILCCPRGVEEKIWPRVWCVEYWCHHLHLALWKAPFLGQDWGWHL